MNLAKLWKVAKIAAKVVAAAPANSASVLECGKWPVLFQRRDHARSDC